MIYRSLERRKKAAEIGLQKEGERVMREKRGDAGVNKTRYTNFMEGKPMSLKDRQRAIETGWKQGPNRPGRPAVEHVTMLRTSRGKPQAVYVRPNGQYVNVSGFTGSPIGNKKGMIVVRSDPEETYLNYLKRLSGDLFGYY